MHSRRGRPRRVGLGHAAAPHLFPERYGLHPWPLPLPALHERCRPSQPRSATPTPCHSAHSARRRVISLRSSSRCPRVISPRGGRSRSRGCRHRLELHGPLLRAVRCEAESGEPRNPVPEPSRTLEAGTRGRGSGWRRGTASCLQIDGQCGEEAPGGGRRGAPAGTRLEARTLARWGRS